MRRVSQEKKENNPCNFKLGVYNIIMNEKKLNKKELLEAIKSYEKMIRNDSLMKTFTKHMRGAFVVRLGRLNAELKRRG